MCVCWGGRRGEGGGGDFLTFCAVATSVGDP